MSDDIDIRWDDLIDFACGDADEDTRERVIAALRDPEHPISYLKSRSSKSVDSTLTVQSPVMFTLNDASQTPLDIAYYVSADSSFDESDVVLGRFDSDGDKISEHKLSDFAEWRRQLQLGKSAVFKGRTHWASVKIAGNDVIVHGGLLPDQKLDRLVFAFFTGEEIVLQTECSDGEMKVALADFESVLERSDSLTITSKD